ncbi:dihydroorotase [Candidatus Omnitrophota bacterium]
MKILIKGGRVVDPANKLDAVSDILIKETKIAKVAPNITTKADRIIEASNKIVVPGLVDMHVHLREPGREDKETIASGTQAAVQGGVTSVLAMPNTQPAMDSPENIQALKMIIKKDACAHVFIAGTITFGRQGRELAAIDSFKKAGAVAITDDGSSLEDEALLLEALKKAKQHSVITICHCEDTFLSKGGVVNFGVMSTMLGLRGVSSESEYARIERDINLAQKVDAPIHIAHVSCKESVEVIAKAKKKKVRVTAETAPHYLMLYDELLLGYDTNLKINPPLRSKEDVKALQQGIKSGIIDCIASDHAPHTQAEKDRVFEIAPCGTIGLETALSVVITELITKGIIDWPQLVQRMAYSPARILGLDKGTLSEGAIADIAIVDPQAEWLVAKEALRSQSRNSAFLGRTLKGVVEHTIIAGEIAYQHTAVSS